MRKKMLQLFLLLALTVGGAAVAQAQTGSPYQANIPFDFTVGGKPFKAGEYSISFGVLRSAPASFLIRSADGKEAAIIADAFLKDVLEPVGRARIIFDKDGDDYVLTQIKSSEKNVEIYKVRKKRKSVKVARVEVSMTNAGL